MKYGSLVNMIMDNQMIEPKVGDPATLLSWSDRRPATVVSWDVDKGIVGVQDDDYVRTDKNGFSEDQTYEYTQNTNNPISHYKLTKKGWKACFKNPQTGRWNTRDYGGLFIGRREKYYDFSF